jgi:hypothetical protein
MTTEEVRRKSIEQFAALRRKALFEAQQNSPITVTPNAAAGSSISGSTKVEPPAFVLVFTDISFANTLVGDATVVEDWNIFFDLPTYGTPFTSVTIVGDEVRLVGGENIIMKAELFADNQNLLSVNDSIGCVVELELAALQGGKSGSNITSINLPSVTVAGDNVFYDCDSLTELNLPLLIDCGDACFLGCILLTTIDLPQTESTKANTFYGCASLTTINLPVCTNLGGTVDNNQFFLSITGNAITLTVPASRMTCKAGGPDGDIQYLQANNTVTIITT